MGGLENEGCVHSPTMRVVPRMKKVCIYLSNILVQQCLLLTIHGLPPLLFAVVHLNGSAEPCPSYLQVCYSANMSTKSNLTLLYSFDKSPGFFPRLGAWTPQQATPSVSPVVG